jgi:hypothetical protein
VKWKDRNDPVTVADRAANAYLVKQRVLAFPDDGILAEESKDDLCRLDKRRVWVVDPLDGTVEFIARNGQFCIMVGLVSDGVPVVWRLPAGGRHSVRRCARRRRLRRGVWRVPGAARFDRERAGPPAPRRLSLASPPDSG